VEIWSLNSIRKQQIFVYSEFSRQRNREASSNVWVVPTWLEQRHTLPPEFALEKENVQVQDNCLFYHRSNLELISGGHVEI
jgi:hypothetical protein